MRLIKPYFEILTDIDGDKILSNIERAGRTCYKSEEKITRESAEKFIGNILQRGHESVIEHESISVRIICDRGVTHEIVRHRLCAYSQESTRYCNYKGGVTFIIPPWDDYEEGEYVQVGSWVIPLKDKNSPKAHELMAKYENSQRWLQGRMNDELEYIKEIKEGKSPQQARSVLPNSLKTEIVMTANLRELCHILNLRCSKAAHPQMREIMIPLLNELHERIPVIFDKLYSKYILT